MPHIGEILSVPVSAPKFQLRVLALHKGKDPGPFGYLQGIRTGLLRLKHSDVEQSDVARTYYAMLPTYSRRLAAMVPGPIDAVLSPPSSLPEHAAPYRRAITAAYPRALDLTPRLGRTGNVRAGDGATVCDLADSLSYQSKGDEKNIRRLVISDDTFTTGTTAAAVVKILRQYGLPDTCEVIAACPLWLDIVKPNASQNAQ